jgi:hypothetical protein
MDAAGSPCINGKSTRPAGEIKPRKRQPALTVTDESEWKMNALKNILPKGNKFRGARAISTNVFLLSGNNGEICRHLWG